MSALFKATIKTSESHEQKVIITTQQINNSIDGNPRHKIQVWIDRQETAGNLWTPTIKGFKRSKDDSYIMESFYIKEDILYFIEAFQKAVLQ